MTCSTKVFKIGCICSYCIDIAIAQLVNSILKGNSDVFYYFYVRTYFHGISYYLVKGTWKGVLDIIIAQYNLCCDF